MYYIAIYNYFGNNLNSNPAMGVDCHFLKNEIVVVF